MVVRDKLVLERGMLWALLGQQDQLGQGKLPFYLLLRVKLRSSTFAFSAAEEAPVPAIGYSDSRSRSAAGEETTAYESSTKESTRSIAGSTLATSSRSRFRTAATVAARYFFLSRSVTGDSAI